MPKHYNTKMKERFGNYQAWIEKQIKNGKNISSQARKYAYDYKAFRERYDTLLREKKVLHRENTVMDLMRQRSFNGGTHSQLYVMYTGIKDELEYLKQGEAKEKELYYNIVLKYPEINSMSFEEIEQVQFRGDGRFFNASYKKGVRGEPGILQVIYYELQAIGYTVYFSSK